MANVVFPIMDYSSAQRAMITGANVDGKPVFAVNAWRQSALNPPMVAFEYREQIRRGILQNRTFSLNVVSFDQIEEFDYLLSISGAEVNNLEPCGFKVFYGTLGTAPLIEQCPTNIECSVLHVIELEPYTLIIGNVEYNRTSEKYLTNGKEDSKKIKPLFFSGLERNGRLYHLYVQFDVNTLDPEAERHILNAKLLPSSESAGISAGGLITPGARRRPREIF